MHDLLSWNLSIKYSQKLCLTFGTQLSSILNWQLPLCKAGEKAKSVMGVLDAEGWYDEIPPREQETAPFCCVVMWNNFWEMKILLPKTWCVPHKLTSQQRGFRSVSLKVAKCREFPSTLKDGQLPLGYLEPWNSQVVTNTQGCLTKSEAFIRIWGIES